METDNKPYVVYWIRHPNHVDILSEGYVGITNNIDRRFKSHKNSNDCPILAEAVSKYGWDSLIKDVVIIGDKNYCEMMEYKLRTKERIGWNLNIGGNLPPVCKKGSKKRPMTDEHRKKIGMSNKKPKPPRSSEHIAKIRANMIRIHTERKLNKEINK